MIIRGGLRLLRSAWSPSTSRAVLRSSLPLSRAPYRTSLSEASSTRASTTRPPFHSSFHTSACLKYAHPQSADDIMENLNDLYGTAKDEFEIAAEETEKKTVYAADDREAAQEAFRELKTAFEQAIRESDPDTGKQVQGRVGPRIRELGNAITAMEEQALED